MTCILLLSYDMYPPPLPSFGSEGAGSVYLNAACNLSLLALFISFKKRTYAKAPMDSKSRLDSKLDSADSAKKVKAS